MDFFTLPECLALIVRTAPFSVRFRLVRDCCLLWLLYFCWCNSLFWFLWLYLTAEPWTGSTLNYFIATLLGRVARGREQKHNETVALLEMCAKLKKETGLPVGFTVDLIPTSAECKRAKADESKFIGEPNYLSVLLFSFSEGLELYFHHMSQITGEAKVGRFARGVGLSDSLFS